MSSHPVNRRDGAAAATRKAVIAAARVAFGTHGFANASLARIAAEANATTGALYHHFNDKKALFTAVAEEIEAELLAAIVRKLPAKADLWGTVVYAVTETLALAARPGIANVIFREASNVIGPSAWREIELRYGYGRLSALLRRLAETGQLGGHDPDIVASLILGAWIQTAEAIVASPTPKRTLRRAQAAIVAMLSGFRTDGS